MFDQALPDVGITFGKLARHLAAFAAENDQRFVRGIGQSACQYDFPSRVRSIREPQMFFTEFGAPGNKLIHNVINEREVRHGALPARLSILP